MVKKKNILFICRHNIFRSRVAESYFNKINKNKNIKVFSAGVIRMDSRPELDDKAIKLQREIAEKLGIKVRGKSDSITTSLLMKQDYIIVVADNVDMSLFKPISYIKKSAKVIRYKVKDVCAEKGKKQLEKDIERAIKQIMKKIDKLCEELK